MHKSIPYFSTWFFNCLFFSLSHTHDYDFAFTHIDQWLLRSGILVKKHPKIVNFCWSPTPHVSSLYRHFILCHRHHLCQHSPCNPPNPTLRPIPRPSPIIYNLSAHPLFQLRDMSFQRHRYKSHLKSPSWHFLSCMRSSKSLLATNVRK